MFVYLLFIALFSNTLNLTAVIIPVTAADNAHSLPSLPVAKPLAPVDRFIMPIALKN